MLTGFIQRAAVCESYGRVWLGLHWSPVCLRGHQAQLQLQVGSTSAPAARSFQDADLMHALTPRLCLQLVHSGSGYLHGKPDPFHVSLQFQPDACLCNAAHGAPLRLAYNSMCNAPLKAALALTNTPATCGRIIQPAACCCLEKQSHPP